MKNSKEVLSSKQRYRLLVRNLRKQQEDKNNEKADNKKINRNKSN